jgi:hypothetical protein
MPKFMKSIQIPIVSTPPVAIVDNVIIYGSDSGLNQSTTGGSKNFDLAGTIVPFSFSDTSPIFIGKSQPNLSIGKVVLQIIAPFNDLTTTITIGDSADHSRLFTSDSNDPNTVNEYSFTPDYKYTSEVDIYLYITGVNTSGNGIVRIYFN